MRRLVNEMKAKQDEADRLKRDAELTRRRLEELRAESDKVRYVISSSQL